MEVQQGDFKEALKDVEPSALREVMVEIPKTKWDQVGGLEEVKQKLKETVEWPLTNPEGFETAFPDVSGFPQFLRQKGGDVDATRIECPNHR